MNVAKLELCAELYKLTDRKWKTPVNEWSFVPVLSESLDDFGKFEEIPQYSLGFLLRKLPHMVELDGLHYVGDHKENRFHLEMEKGDPIDAWEWAYYYSNGGETQFYSSGDTPEDAAAKLCIELIKQGILPKESK